MIRKTATVQNTNGIHVRPSQVISSSMADYTGNISITSPCMKINDTNTISIISLGLIKNDNIEITVEGPDEEAAAEKLVALFEKVYDFPPRS